MNRRNETIPENVIREHTHTHIVMSIVRINNNLLCSSHVRMLLGTRICTAKNLGESKIAQQPRQSVAYSTGSFLNDTLIAPAQRYDWKQIVRDAEKTVDYPTSFTNLRWLLSDKVANVGLQLRKLAASTNLLHRTARYIYYYANTYGLLTVVVAVAAI